MRVPLRWNVLVLMTAAYITLLLVFTLLVVTGAPGATAYQFIKDPLLALVGGTLAIAKDLIPIGDAPPGPAPAEPTML